MIKQVVTIIAVTVFVLFILSLFDIVSNSFFISSVIAGAVNIVNAFAANYFFEKSYKGSNSTFLFYNLGGMGLRLGFLLVFIFIVIKFLKIDEYGFILLFFIFYFMSLFFEVNYFRKKAKKQVKSKQ